MTAFLGQSGQEWDLQESQKIGDPGGMGEVFTGIGPNGQKVAIKRVRLVTSATTEKRRREREIEIADSLIEAKEAGSPVDHLLLPLDRAVVRDDLFIVMPLGEESLRAAIRSDRMTEEDRLDAFREVVLGLVELATISILHRDLKPENVLRHDGTWKLADFGLARNLTEATATHTFLAWGTPPYMAPELWDQKPATSKSDLYALGVLAYELLVGTRPFPGPDAEDYRKQHREDAPPNPNLDAVLTRILLRLLRKEPSTRYQDARAVSDSLSKHRLAHATPELRDLAVAAAADEARRVQEEARAASLAGVAQSAAAEQSQALSDLREIVQEAVDQIQVVIPEVRFEDDGWQLHLRDPDHFVTLSPFARVVKSSEADAMVVSGAITWRDESSGLKLNISAFPVANIVCERRTAGLVWFVLQFSAMALAANGNYPFGPEDRPHGFTEDVFDNQRSKMVTSAGLGAWTMKMEVLDANVLIRAFTGALEGHGLGIG
jgi:hypothetical protein